MDKAPDAFRTISEVADDLDVPQHVLRFWESRFREIKPMKRGGGRRYYRPDDVDLLRGIRHLLYGEGYTIRGVQRILREQGLRVRAERLAAGRAAAGAPAARGCLQTRCRRRGATTAGTSSGAIRRRRRGCRRLPSAGCGARMWRSCRPRCGAERMPPAARRGAGRESVTAAGFKWPSLLRLPLRRGFFFHLPSSLLFRQLPLSAHLLDEPSLLLQPPHLFQAWKSAGRIGVLAAGRLALRRRRQQSHAFVLLLRARGVGATRSASSVAVLASAWRTERPPFAATSCPTFGRNEAGRGRQARRSPPATNDHRA